jgi:MscS family membrane protein
MRLMKKLSISFLFLNIFFSSNFLYAQIAPSAAVTPNEQSVIAQSESAISELSNPRSVLETFLKQMDNFAAGQQTAIELAMQCLDLTEIPEFIRKEQGASLAIKLHSILSKTKIELWKISSKEVGVPFVLRSDEHGQIVIEKSELNWRFSKPTIRNIPELFFKLKDEKILRETKIADQQMISSFSLRQYMPELLSKRVLSLEYWQILGIFLALLIAYFAKLLFFHTFRKICSYLATKLGTLPEGQSISGFVRPLGFIAAVYVYHFCLYMLDLDPVIYSGLLRLLEIIKILAIFIFLLKSFDLIAEILELRPKTFFGPSGQILIPLGRTLAKIVLFIVGVILISNLFSINLTGLIAGLGIGGLALALAAKDTVENLFGSITVLVDKPFKVGDFISIEGVTGTVENIGLRSTRLRTLENSLLTIPNSKLISVIVDNLGARMFFRTRLSIGLTYETPVEKLEQFCQGVRDLLENNREVRADYFVHFNEFASSSFNIVIQAYFQAVSAANHLALQEKFFTDIIKLAKYLGVEFAYPVQRHVETTTNDSVDREVNPEDLKQFLKTL